MEKLKKFLEKIFFYTVITICIPIMFITYFIWKDYRDTLERIHPKIKVLRLYILDFINIEEHLIKSALNKKKQLPYIDYKGMKFYKGDKVSIILKGKEKIERIINIEYDNKEAIFIKTVSDDKILAFWTYPQAFNNFNIKKIEIRKGPLWL